MGNRYLVVSDLHLCDVEEHDDGWKAYKSARYLWDEEFARLLDRFLVETGDANPTLILNGDTFDFDLVSAVPDPPPWPVSVSERRRGLDATAEKSVWKLEQVLSHHPRFLDALVDYLARGHRLVCLMGNHDRELHFPEVRRTFLDALLRVARARPTETTFQADQIQFEPWFYHVPGEIYVEHGNQYDYYTSFGYLLSPVVDSDGHGALALPMGNLSNRFLLTRMGFFNPHASDFILNPFAYVNHWLRHYAFSRRGLVFNWLFGSISVVLRLIAVKGKLAIAPPNLVARKAEIAARFSLPSSTIDALERLQRPPITSKLFRMLRELWIDRVLMAVLMTAGTVALALVPIPLWIKWMVPLSSFPLAFAIYEWLARGDTIFSIEHELPGYARAIARLLPVKVVTFGHTHVPRLVPLGASSTFVDTGTWAPIMGRKDEGQLTPGYRNYLVLDCTSDEATVQLRCWDSGH